MVYTSAVNIIILYIIYKVCANQVLPCPKHLSINITDGKNLPDGIILKNNVKFNKDNYYIENGTKRGCICNIIKCIQMCCDFNEFLNNKTCIHQQENETSRDFFNGSDILGTHAISEFSYITVNTLCPKNYGRYPTEEGEVLQINKNGSLSITYGTYHSLYNPGYYCLTKNADKSLLALYCEFIDTTTEDMGKMYAKGMIISMPFLLITFLVYAILPDSNLHRKALMNYVLTLLLAYICLVTVQLYPGKFEEFMCKSLGYLIIFFFLVSFFWMNVMCLDMWFAFSGMRGFNGRRFAERKRFFMYFGYAFGVPLLHILVVFLINHFGEAGATYHPGIGAVKCFLEDGIPNLLYFYGPMALLITINVTLFILTAVKIQKVKKETSMLKHSDSKRHSYEDDKQKFNLYVKLLFAMGINWTMEVISWAVQWKMKENVPAYVWYLTDFCNAMYGVFIFFIFVFKKKIWNSLKKRYYAWIGKPHFAHSMSVTQTTRSSNYSTTETGLSDHRLSELKNGRAEERMLSGN